MDIQSFDETFHRYDPFHASDCTWISPTQMRHFPGLIETNSSRGLALVVAELVVQRYLLCKRRAGLLTLEILSAWISLFAEDLEIYGVQNCLSGQNSTSRPASQMRRTSRSFSPRIALLSKGTVVPTSLVVEFL